MAIVKGDVSLISFLARLLSVCKRATEFFELILYLVTLLKVFVSYRSSFVEIVGSLMYTIMSSAYNKVCFLPFQFVSIDLLFVVL